MAQGDPKTVYAQEDSGNGEQIGVVGSDPGEQVQYLDDSQPKPGRDAANNALLVDEQDLEPGKINWLGSSYTGVDIKVVAHLYGQDEVDAETKSLQQQLEAAELTADGARQVRGTDAFVFLGPGGDQRFLDATGLDQASVEDGRSVIQARGTLLNIWASAPKTSLALFRATLMSNLDTTATYNDSLANSLRDRIAAREEVRKKSTTTLTLANLQTLSVQTHREKVAARALGQSHVKGYTRGPRTIAGSMIFTVFNEHALASLIRSMASKRSMYGEGNDDLATLIADQLPPLDLTIVFANEYGNLSQMGIYGVEFVNDGMTMSIEDLLTESVTNFVARDVDVMTAKGNVLLSRRQRGFSEEGIELTGSDLLFASSDSYNAYLDRLKVRRRISHR
jgi:hypothetical protein